MVVGLGPEDGWGECNSPLRAMGARIPGQLHQRAMLEPVWGLPMRGLKNICGPRSNRPPCPVHKKRTRWTVYFGFIDIENLYTLVSSNLFAT